MNIGILLRIKLHLGVNNGLQFMRRGSRIEVNQFGMMLEYGEFIFVVHTPFIR
jgi:hypothetical protein